MKGSRITIQRLFRRWKYLRILIWLIQSLGLALPSGVLIAQWLPAGLSTILFLIIWMITAGAGYYFSVSGAGPADIADYLNRHYPELEESADLLLKSESELSLLNRLQRDKISTRLESLGIYVPVRKKMPTAIFLAGLALATVIYFFPGREGAQTGRTVEKKSWSLSDPDSVTTSSSPVVNSARVVIIPPAYTGLPKEESGDLNLRVPYASTIRWEIEFSQADISGYLLLGDHRKLPLKRQSEETYTTSFQMLKDNFYSIVFGETENRLRQSGYYQLEIAKDDPPSIQVKGLSPYTEYPYDSTRQVTFSVVIGDDYGIEDAWMVATVSKGEGESVKFRDDTLRFDSDFNQRKKEYKLEKILLLNALGMVQGDELYFHVEVRDNRYPGPQISRTSKYIIAFSDTSSTAFAMTGGLAINRMPKYFRSQRQIIIDTENLIKEESGISDRELSNRSNNIASDQKLLRLRYGRFLGEEFETVIGSITREDHKEEEEEEEGEHDHEAEGHDHGEGEQPAPESPSGIAELEPYLHAHDIAEEVTFYDELTAAKLRAALAQMWEAELHLRLSEPRQALPFEYRALKLIKEIQQASRIYVERIGFEPPVIKVEEKRLTGELEDILAPSFTEQADGNERLQSFRTAVALLEKLIQQRRFPEDREKKALEKAGDELVALALERPGFYLTSLQKLRLLLENQLPDTRLGDDMRFLQHTFSQLLPDEEKPVVRNQRRHRLKELFIEEINKK